MANAEMYQACLRFCFMASNVLKDFDIPSMLREIEHAETVGPIVDPTLWIKNNKKMAIDKKLLEAALPLATFVLSSLEK